MVVVTSVVGFGLLYFVLLICIGLDWMHRVYHV